MPFTILFNKEIWNIPKKNNETLMPQNGKMFNNAIEVGCSWNNYRFISRQELSLMNITFYECPIPRALCKFFLKLKSVDFLMTPSKDDLKNQCHHFLKCPRTWNINKIKPLNCNKLYKLPCEIFYYVRCQQMRHVFNSLHEEVGCQQNIVWHMMKQLHLFLFIRCRIIW